MLPTNCPKCKGHIKSPSLKSSGSVRCDQCDELVNVEKVAFAAKDFTVDREDLQKRIFRYESLLQEVEKERRLMADDQRIAQETRQSFDQFCLTLQELLAGTKSCYRLKMTRDLSLLMEFAKHKSKVRLIDISTAGASLEPELLDKLPKPSAMLNLELTLPGLHEPWAVLAKVVWVRKLTNESSAECYRIGVKFVNLDEQARAGIWRFITQNSAGVGSSFVV